jgi:LysM repeat protein
MKTMQKWLSVLIVVAVVFSVMPRSATVTAQTSLLVNGGFEDAGTGSTATSWTAWWLEAPKPSDGSYNYAYKPRWNVEKLNTGAARELVYAGNNSQRVINNWDPWYAGVRQTVTAPAGARVRLTAYARVWASASDWPSASDPAAPVKAQVGIDPNGGDNAFGSSVAWSAAIAPHGGWQSVSVEAVVGSAGRVTVFLGVDYRGSSRFWLGSFWDEASLVVVSGGTPIPGATSTPAPTLTRTATPTGTRTIVPPPATLPPAVYVVHKGDTLSVIAKRFGVTLAALMAANNIKNADRIYVGQALRIPGGSVLTPTPPATNPATGATPVAMYYIVQKGDVPGTIARKFNVSLQAFLDINPAIVNGVIYAGQRVYIPVGGLPATPMFGPVTVTVRAGDTLSRLARLYNTTVERLKQLNNLKTDSIYVGQRLIVAP